MFRDILEMLFLLYINHNPIFQKMLSHTYHWKWWNGVLSIHIFITTLNKTLGEQWQELMPFHYSYIVNILVDILSISKSNLLIKFYHMILVTGPEFTTIVPHGDVVERGVVNHFKESMRPAPSDLL